MAESDKEVPLFDQHRETYESWLDSDDPVKRVLAEVLAGMAGYEVSGDRDLGGTTPSVREPSDDDPDAGELLEAVEAGELTAAEAREQLADATDETP